MLKEGTDYIVGGINNVAKSSSGAFAYVKGIGKYGGYALVPITIGSGFIKHIGLSGVGTSVIANKSGSTYSIGSSNKGSYVRNVPAKTTASKMLGKIKSKKSKYTLAIIDAKGKKVSGSTAVATGMMVGVYKGSTLVGTADITVNGKAINNTGANYLRKANRKSSVPVNSSTGSATVGNGKLDVDGEGGPATVKALRKFLGVNHTGKLKIKKSLRKYNTSVKSRKNSSKSDPTVKAMQKWLGVEADGKWGKNTSKALQKKLGINASGYFGKKSMKALQRYLNAHM